MANLSDIIEQFILSALDYNESVEIGRNDLADHFSVAPSQINYVLSTRFTNDRGFDVTSKRGGGGSITIAKLSDNCLEYIDILMQERQSISYKAGVQLLERLQRRNIITQSELAIIQVVISDKALKNPFQLSDRIRLQVLREILIKLINKA